MNIQNRTLVNKIYSFVATKINDKWLSSLAFLFVVIGLGTLAFFLIFLFVNLNSAWGSTDKEAMEITGNIGDFFGGVLGSFWALAGVFLLYLTLKMQKEELLNQRREIQNTREIFEIQKFETFFFNLLQHQRDIIPNLKIRVPVFSNGVKDFSYDISEVTGALVFEAAINELRNIIDVLLSPSSLDPNLDSYSEKLLALNAEYEIFDYKYMEKLIDFNRLEYQDSYSVINKSFMVAVYQSFYNISNREKTIFKSGSPETQCKLIYSILFDKMGDSIGHYFRSYYHILKFIDNAKSNLTNEVVQPEKSKVETEFMSYAQFIQAQLSSDELLMIFYNATCFPKACQLILKYNMLENLSSDSLLDEMHNGVLGISLVKKDSYLRKDVVRLFDLKTE